MKDEAAEAFKSVQYSNLVTHHRNDKDLQQTLKEKPSYHAKTFHGIEKLGELIYQGKDNRIVVLNTF